MEFEVKLKKLIAKLPINWVMGSKESVISGLSMHSQSVAPGTLFIAKAGATDLGLKHIEEAILSGAVAILSTEVIPFVPAGIVQLSCRDLPMMQVALAKRFYADPASKLLLCGITGTNGKTTIGFLLKHLLERLGQKTGLIGTIAYMIGDVQLAATLTTPDVITNYKLLHDMVRCHCRAAVMEVSSHALVQGRVAGLEYDAAIFTNLTQDHLDYHGTMEAYGEAKRLLFLGLSSHAYAIVNEESPAATTLLQGSQAKVVTYGCSPDADVCAHHLVLTPTQIAFHVTTAGEEAPFVIPMVGKHNVLNALAAITFCMTQGYSLEQISAACCDFSGVPGRLERVENRLGLHIYIDFAHTPDGLEQVCGTLRTTSPGRLFVVFGAGGDRDSTKRSLMGTVVDRYAHFTCITADNPRSEDPFTICQKIAAGFASQRYLIEVDRRMAIAQILKMAQAGDSILIAGKGHEPYQIFAHHTLPFDDRLVVQQLLEDVRCL